MRKLCKKDTWADELRNQPFELIEVDEIENEVETASAEGLPQEKGKDIVSSRGSRVRSRTDSALRKQREVNEVNSLFCAH